MGMEDKKITTCTNCTNKDGKECVNNHTPGQENKHLHKRKDKGQTWLNKSSDGSGPGQGTSPEYEITDEHCVSPHRNPAKRKDLEKDRRNGGETVYTTTGRAPSGKG